MGVQAGVGGTISPLRGWQRLLFLLGLGLLWPALVAGDVYGFNDTVSYLRGADTVVAKLIGRHDPFFTASAPAECAPSVSGQREGSCAGEEAPPPTETMVLYGRSLYFGLFLYPGLLAGFWLPVAVQALATGAVIVAAVRHFVDPSRVRAFLGATLAAFGLAALTPLPFFVCFLMPDLAVGLALLAAALLLGGWRRERWRWRVGLGLLLAFAALSHSTALAVLALLGLGALGTALWRRSRTLALAGGVLLGAALIGVAGDAAFALASRATTGTDPVRPPFLTARLIEDGPGLRFLDEHCAGADFVLCRYPLSGHPSAEVFLWEPTRPHGGFKALPVPDAVQVAHEQTRFAIAVARAYPRETATDLVRDFVALSGNLRLHDFRLEFLASRMRADRPFQAVPTELPLLDRAISVLTALAIAIAAVALVLLWRRRAPQVRAIVAAAAIAILLNDALCAWLSGPFARYNTRAVWAFPLLVLLLALAPSRGQSIRSATTSRER